MDFILTRFHHNSFLAARALHAIKTLNASLVFDWVDTFFANQVGPLPDAQSRMGNGAASLIAHS